MLVVAVQRPELHVSPEQHVAVAEHPRPDGTHAVVLGTQRELTQRPEQHDEPAVHVALSPRQVDVPVAPQAPLVHRDEQHCVALVQETPSGRQVVPPEVQRPPVQVRPEQHEPHAPPHTWPDVTHCGVTLVHAPPAHVPEQHCELLVHAAPGKAQVTKSWQVPCEQMAGKQHSPLVAHDSPPPLQSPEPMDRMQVLTPPEGKQVMPGQQPSPSDAELKQRSS